MISLAGIRSELRALMALDERGEIDQPHRHKVLFRIVADLQDYEINQPILEEKLRKGD